MTDYRLLNNIKSELYKVYPEASDGDDPEGLINIVVEWLYHQEKPGETLDAVCAYLRGYMKANRGAMWIKASYVNDGFVNDGFFIYSFNKYIPSTDIAMAYELVEELWNRGWFLRNYIDDDTCASSKIAFTVESIDSLGVPDCLVVGVTVPTFRQTALAITICYCISRLQLIKKEIIGCAK